MPWQVAREGLEPRAPAPAPAVCPGSEVGPWPRRSAALSAWETASDISLQRPKQLRNLGDLFLGFNWFWGAKGAVAGGRDEQSWSDGFQIDFLMFGESMACGSILP